MNLSKVKGKNCLAGYLLSIILFAILFCNNATAQSANPSEREVIFKNGSIELHGTFMLPSSVKGAVPAIVFIHGSGPMTRAGFKPYAEEFAKLGFASLFYDKRGTGSSGGSWLRASLGDLTGDALAGVNYLKSQKEIDSKRIGFWGISQAGWIETKAAAESGDIGFMIVISGGGASPKESELFSYEKAFEDLGWSESEKDAGFKIVDQYFHYLSSGKDRDKLVTRLDDILGPDNNFLKPLAKRLKQITPSQANQQNWSWIVNYNPAQDIAKVGCPVLLMFGDKDKENPTELAVKKWKEGLKKAGNDKATIMVFPGAGHGIRMKEHYKEKGRAPFADGYVEVMVGWLIYHIIQGN
jgi:pimeloyl-ACP methyl ester carboxylesterase